MNFFLLTYQDVGINKQAGKPCIVPLDNIADVIPDTEDGSFISLKQGDDCIHVVESPEVIWDMIVGATKNA